VNKDQIAEIVTKEPDLTRASRKLIDLANAAGGPDNITVIVARFDGPGLTQAGDEDEVGHQVFSLRDSGASGPMDRVMTGTTPTEAMPVVERPGMVRPTPIRPTEHAVLPPLEAMAPPPPPPPPAPDVSPARRSAGRLIAIGLFALLMVAGVWFVMHSTRSATDSSGTSGTSGTSVPRP
jgi:hypothetical protein